MKNRSARQIAFGGMMGAVALVIMCLGGLIPIATYVCPILCAILGAFVLRFCGKRIAWTWYAAVCILCILIGPDKEAAFVFLFLGNYPYFKQLFDRIRFGTVIKFLYFNGVTALLYFCVIYLLGIEQVVQEFAQLQIGGLCILLVLGNLTFILLDRVLERVAVMGG